MSLIRSSFPFVALLLVSAACGRGAETQARVLDRIPTQQVCWFEASDPRTRGVKAEYVYEIGFDSRSGKNGIAIYKARKALEIRSLSALKQFTVADENTRATLGGRKVTIRARAALDSSRNIFVYTDAAGGIWVRHDLGRGQVVDAPLVGCAE